MADSAKFFTVDLTLSFDISHSHLACPSAFNRIPSSMATDRGTMTFFAFPREIRDLIYTYLIPNEKTYSITSANAVANAKAFATSAPDLGIINTSKVVQYEMLEAFYPNNTFRISCPGADTSPQSMD